MEQCWDRNNYRWITFPLLFVKPFHVTSQCIISHTATGEMCVGKKMSMINKGNLSERHECRTRSCNVLISTENFSSFRMTEWSINLACHISAHTITGHYSHVKIKHDVNKLCDLFIKVNLSFASAAHYNLQSVQVFPIPAMLLLYLVTYIFIYVYVFPLSNLNVALQ